MIKKLYFDDEGLVVDWLSFKINDLDSLEQKRLVDYFFQSCLFERSSLLERDDSTVFWDECQEILQLA